MRNLFQEIELVEQLPGSFRHGAERVLRDMHGQTGFLRNQFVDSGQQGTAASQHNTAINEVGTLAQIAQAIGEHGGNIENLSMAVRAADFYEMHIDVEVRDLKHLNKIISELRRTPVVSAVSRLNG